MNPLQKADQLIADRMESACRAQMAAGPEGCGCAVLLTAQGNLYSEIFMIQGNPHSGVFMPWDDDGWEERLLEQLSPKGDTVVEYVLILPFVVPGLKLVNLLMELHPHNMETRVLLPKPGDPRYRPLRDFQPPKR